MKILFITSRKLDPESGGGRRSKAIIDALSKWGSVDMIYFDNKNEISRGVPSKSVKTKASFKYRIALSLQFLKVTFPFLYRIFKPRRLRLVNYSNNSFHLKLEYDVIWYFKIQAWILGKDIVYSSKRIVDFDDLDYEKTLGRAFLTKDWINKYLLKLIAISEKRLARSVASKTYWNFVCSNLQVANLGVRNCSALPNIIESQITKAEVEKRMLAVDGRLRKCLIHVGNYSNDANIDGLEWFCKEVFPLITQEDNSIYLRIYGKSSHLVRHLGGSNIEVYGEFRAFEELICDTLPISIAPTRFGSGTRVKIIESMSIGVPVLATSKGAEGIEVLDGVDILIGDDPNILAAKCLSLFNDRAQYARLSLASLEVINRKYSITSIEEEIRKILNNNE